MVQADRTGYENGYPGHNQQNAFIAGRQKLWEVDLEHPPAQERYAYGPGRDAQRPQRKPPLYANPGVQELQEAAAIIECTDRQFLPAHIRQRLKESGGRTQLQERLTALKRLVVELVTLRKMQDAQSRRLLR